MMNANILEIFQSIQGEGAYAGVKQVFVRFYECNMFCTWCDTPHSIGEKARHKMPNASPRYQEMAVEDVLAEVDRLWDHTHSISLTGGEPLVQADFIRVLIPELKKRGYPVHLETNGILFDQLTKVIDGVDVVAMDLKLPSSTKDKSYWAEHEAFLKISRDKPMFIKMVITKETQEDEVLKAAALVGSVDPNILFILQPNSFEIKDGIVQQCVEFQRLVARYVNDVRVIPQMHKMLKVR